MTRRFAANLITENAGKFKDSGDGNMSYNYYGSVLSYVIIEDKVHVSCMMRDTESFTGEFKKGDLNL